MIAIFFCFALALATNRAMLIHWNCGGCQDNQLSYPFPLRSLIQVCVFCRVGIIGLRFFGSVPVKVISIHFSFVRNGFELSEI